MIACLFGWGRERKIFQFLPWNEISHDKIRPPMHNKLQLARPDWGNIFSIIHVDIRYEQPMTGCFAVGPACGKGRHWSLTCLGIGIRIMISESRWLHDRNWRMNNIDVSLKHANFRQQMFVNTTVQFAKNLTSIWPVNYINSVKQNIPTAQLTCPSLVVFPGFGLGCH